MADKKISALTAATTPLAGTEVFPIVQSATTVKASVADVQAAPVAAGTANAVQYLNGSKVPTTNANLNYDGTNLSVGGTALATAANRTVFTINGVTSAFQSFGISGTRYAHFYVDTTEFAIASAAGASGAINLQTNGGTTLSIGGSAASNVTVNTGNLVIGTSGKGIDFSATSGTGTSELLADYEEGTWTPIDSSGAGLTLTVNSATYTKIGRIVTAFAYVVYPSTVSGATVTIGGLPFTTRGSNGGFQPFPVATDASIGIYGYTAQNATTATFYNNSTNAAITNANISTKYLLIAITYTT